MKKYCVSIILVGYYCLNRRVSMESYAFEYQVRHKSKKFAMIFYNSYC